MILKDPKKSNIIAHDADWQFPAITEKHAYLMVRKHLWHVEGVIYLAFPWATLIDQLNTSRKSAAHLLEQLRAITSLIDSSERVVTVCQHIHMVKFIDVFIDHGVTDIFWPHTLKGQTSIKGERDIHFYPFPLFPVQFASRCEDADNIDRKYLFSFIGARANKWYMTESRNWILDQLGGDDRGLVVGRDQWHYNKVVYDLQIRKTKKSQKNLVDKDASEQFRDVLKQTLFSLCPSGSGPNSIRLWESIAAGSIPVILSDDHALPGNLELWNEAVIFCKETEEDIRVLPDRLEALSKDKALLAHKWKMLEQLWNLYGSDPFIYDIQKLYIDIANSAHLKVRARKNKTEKLSLADLAEVVQLAPSVSSEEFFLNACISRILVNSDNFLMQLKSSYNVRKVLDKAIGRNPKSSTVIRYKTIRMGLDTASFDSGDVPEHKTKQLSRMKICLKGKHSNRTPMAYEVYRPHFDPDITFVTNPAMADFVVTGFNTDFTSNLGDVERGIATNPDMKLCVISEEPLWDTVWSKGYHDQERLLKAIDKTIPYLFYNHENTDIFNFETLPYFITTNDDFFTRYGNLFRRNASMSVDALLEHWQSCEIRTAFYFARRNDARYDVLYPEDNISGLCTYRTTVAELTEKGPIVRIGEGWSKSEKIRQALPDWHLDKLTALNKKAMIVSGFENTHQKNYITEKIYDAFAVLSIPIYYASSQHRIHEAVPYGGFINTFGMSAEESARTVDEFSPNREFAQNYLATQKQLATLFSDGTNLVQERKRVADSIIAVLQGKL